MQNKQNELIANLIIDCLGCNVKEIHLEFQTYPNEYVHRINDRLIDMVREQGARSLTVDVDYIKTWQMHDGSFVDMLKSNRVSFDIQGSVIKFDIKTRNQSLVPELVERHQDLLGRAVRISKF